MGQALYRQYRPRSLAEVVGQDHITKTLLHALQQEKLGHAYLFTGPRGTGKTSIARILAHEISGLAYEDDAIHLDIIEIDAASNRRIDEIRDLRDKVHTAPTSAKFKVYIIDEVHMLTREAFNALLKTLEEPPAHVIFILATTEVHKLPETIISRTQRFSFHPVSLDQVRDHLRTIADKEDIDITDEALGLVAAYGEGSFRDSISLLDQIRGREGQVDADFVRSLIGIPTTEAIEALTTAVQNADAPTIVQLLTQLREQGFSAPQVAKHLGQHLRANVVAGKGTAGIFDLLAALLDVPTKHNPESALELCLLGHALSAQLPAAAAPTYAQARPAMASIAYTPQATQTQPAQQQQQPTQQRVTPFRDKAQSASSQAPASRMTEATQPEVSREQLGDPIEPDSQLWPEVLNSLKKTHNTLYGIARMAKPVFYQDAIELGFTFAFHKKRVNEPKNKEVITTVIKNISGRDMALHCTLLSKNATPFDDPAPSAASSPAPNDNATTAPAPDINAISNIFGSAEVLPG
jgi:DNA polymerase-3 subunit gamma/tau